MFNVADFRDEFKRKVHDCGSTKMLQEQTEKVVLIFQEAHGLQTGDLIGYPVLG